jgi:serine/threonine protein kinase
MNQQVPSGEPAGSRPVEVRTTLRTPLPVPAQAPPQVAPPADGNALPVGTLLGEFELLGVVGEGGFGIVYRAWDRALDRPVAIKEYLPASIAVRGRGAQVSERSQQ